MVHDVKNMLPILQVSWELAPGMARSPSSHTLLRNSQTTSEHTVCGNLPIVSSVSISNSWSIHVVDDSAQNVHERIPTSPVEQAVSLKFRLCHIQPLMGWSS